MSDAMQREIDALRATLDLARSEAGSLVLDLDAATEELELLQDDIAEHLPHYVLDDGTDEPANARETVEYAGDELKQLRRRIRELEARVTGGLAGEPRQAYRGEGAAASDEQPRPASPPTSAVGDLLANVIRKMTLHDWHLRLTQEEANALKQWVLERNGENKPRRRGRRFAAGARQLRGVAMVITPEERARAVVRAVLSAYFDGASFRNVPPRCIAALSRFDLEYGNKKRREVEDLTVAGQGAHPMTAPEKVIGFEEDCDHVLCERCCKDGRMCCEKEWRVCEDCDGGTVYYDSDDDDERSYGRECRPAPCETCDGAGGWWFCSCDENGNHARKQP